MPDPEQRINMRKKIENRRRRTLKSPSQKMLTAEAQAQAEAEKCDIAFKWMHQFELMHQERMGMSATIQLLEADGVRKDEQIRYLNTDLMKSNTDVSEKKSLLQKQLKTILRQQHFMREQQKECQKLRALIWRLKRTNRLLKKDRKEIPKPETLRGPLPTIKCALKKQFNSKYCKSPFCRKAKYTKNDLDMALKAVSDGLSLGRASDHFKVPKETLRQAKLKVTAQTTK